VSSRRRTLPRWTNFGCVIDKYMNRNGMQNKYMNEHYSTAVHMQTPPSHQAP
jgi:hypothetical protein